MAIDMEALVEAVIKDLNANYKTISELSREMGYPTTAYLSRKIKQLKVGARVKDVVLLSKREQEIVKNSIHRREKEEE